MRRDAKFRQNQSTCCGDIAILLSTPIATASGIIIIILFVKK